MQGDLEVVVAGGPGVGADGKPYGIARNNLVDMNANKDAEALQKVGGTPGLAKSLHTDTHVGLSNAQVDASRRAFGANEFPSAPRPSLFALLFEAIKDPMVLILLGVAAITIVVGAAVPEQRAHNGWSEGIAVLVTATVVVCIAAGQDYGKELQFQKLNALKDVTDVKVTRNGVQAVIRNTELVVGDVLHVDTGDKLAADGLVIDSQGLVIDEASLTGESEPIKKSGLAGGDPWVRSGTSVQEGSGRVLITAVGLDSEWGKTLALVSEAGDDMTPLQEQLKELAARISKFGVSVAIICFLALFIKWLVVNKGFDVDKINNNGPLQFLLYAITITVVSIPEGLPLAVTLTLAYSMKKMMKDNNFVRVLAACETMGGATAICSDKTGTLTQNRMTVVEGWFCGKHHATMPGPNELSPLVHAVLSANACLNSKAFLVDAPPEAAVVASAAVAGAGGDDAAAATAAINASAGFVGNRTECALLVMARRLGHDYAALRNDAANTGILLREWGFSSATKMSSVLLKDKTAPGGLRLHNKGAAEWVLKKCSHVISGDKIVPMTDDSLKGLMDTVTAMASRGLRCICLAYRDMTVADLGLPAGTPLAAGAAFEGLDAAVLGQGLTAYAIVGIKDPVRPEVPGAVSTCQAAGVVVRMVTGDNIHTACHIAKECGLYDPSAGHLAMEGPDFRAMPANELLPLLPRLRVLARSSPADKLTLVSLLKQTGEVVAVTGDGTNDAPALKESDVGLAMGIAGTEVAKEAADIIILDDNFGSIVKSVLWGRCVYMNIRKFLVFQLSINVVALVSAAVGAIAGGVPPLNVLQLLWVNAIMDTLAALALATEDPYPELLDDPPHGRHEPLITPLMYLHIITSSFYKLFWVFVCLYALPVIIPRYAIKSRHTFYMEECPLQLRNADWNETEVPQLCNWITRCGFPEGEWDRQTPLCSLFNEWLTNNSTGVPNNARDAICRTTPGTDCPWFKKWEDARDDLQKEYDREELREYKPALSVLFNAFIMNQIVNAFVSRRIGLELDFFKGVHKSAIFLSIMVGITVAQVIIMQTPLSNVFKVQPLNGGEWGACIAIGLGVLPYSWACRIICRALVRCGCTSNRFFETLRGPRNSGRTLSGRTLSGNPHKSGDSRTPSGRPVEAGMYRKSLEHGGTRTSSGKPVQLTTVTTHK